MKTVTTPLSRKREPLAFSMLARVMVWTVRTGIPMARAIWHDGSDRVAGRYFLIGQPQAVLLAIDEIVLRDMPLRRMGHTLSADKRKIELVYGRSIETQHSSTIYEKGSSGLADKIARNWMEYEGRYVPPPPPPPPPRVTYRTIWTHEKLTVSVESVLPAKVQIAMVYELTDASGKPQLWLIQPYRAKLRSKLKKAFPGAVATRVGSLKRR